MRAGVHENVATPVGTVTYRQIRCGSSLPKEKCRAMEQENLRVRLSRLSVERRREDLLHRPYRRGTAAGGCHGYGSTGRHRSGGSYLPRSDLGRGACSWWGAARPCCRGRRCFCALHRADRQRATGLHWRPEQHSHVICDVRSRPRREGAWLSRSCVSASKIGPPRTV